MPSWDSTKERLHRDDVELAEAYDAMEPAYMLAREVIRCRAELQISQAELARRVGTSQSVISRIENMETSPNLKTVLAVADALGRQVELRFVDQGELDAKELPDWVFGTPDEFARGLKKEASRTVAGLTTLVRDALVRAHEVGHAGADEDREDPSEVAASR